MANILLNYLRRFPLDYGKMQLSHLVNLSKVPSPIEYTNSMGIKFELHLEEYLMKQVFLFDIYERNTVRYLRKLVKPGMTCLDCGANSGFYTLTLAKCAGPTGQVHAFEPLSVNYRRLETNIHLNRFRNITLNQFGLSNQEKDLKIFYGGNNLGTASVYRKARQNEEMIHLRPLDEYCDARGIKTVDFIKIDIEGAEMECILGAQKVINRSPKVAMILEIMEDNCNKAGYTSEELFSLVRDMGFKAYIPKAWPRNLIEIDQIPPNYIDNIIFLKGYE